MGLDDDQEEATWGGKEKEEEVVVGIEGACTWTGMSLDEEDVTPRSCTLRGGKFVEEGETDNEEEEGDE